MQIRTIKVKKLQR